MPRGGARPGAGRPRKNPPPEKSAAEKSAAEKSAAESLTAAGADADVLIGHYEDPKDFLRALMNEGKADMRLRAQAAVALMPFEHKKLGDGTKKDDAAKKAEAVSAGRFGARPPPLKRVA